MPPVHVLVRLAGRAEVVAVTLTPHAVERYAERVRPGLDLAAARDDLEQVAGVAVVSRHPAGEAIGGSAPLWLDLGDVAFPLEPDARDRERLVATTCLIRHGLRPPRRRARRRPSADGRRRVPYERLRRQDLRALLPVPDAV